MKRIPLTGGRNVEGMRAVALKYLCQGTEDHNARERGARPRLLIQPPASEPTLNAARKVEINHAHTMSDDPKWGLRSRDASS